MPTSEGDRRRTQETTTAAHFPASHRDQPPHSTIGLEQPTTEDFPGQEDDADDLREWDVEEVPSGSKLPLKHRYHVPPPIDQSSFLDSSDGLPVPHSDLAHEHQPLATYTHRARLLAVLANTNSLSEAWEAYHSLHTLHPNITNPGYHYYLRRLARMLASSRPRTRSTFLRLLSVLSTLHRIGGKIRIQEWNALIMFAGKGYRYLRARDYQNALDVYEDLVRGLAPGATLAARRPEEEQEIEFDSSRSDDTDAAQGSAEVQAAPDVATYTTLLDIAARTKHPPAIRHAMSLLTRSGLLPSRVTHLVMLRYFGRAGDLVGVRETLFRLKHQGQDIGLDGLNSALYAYVLGRRVDIANTIYRVMRHRLQPEPRGIGNTEEYLRDTEGVEIPSDVVPDAVTYTTMVQALSYRGELSAAVRVFMDMITSVDPRTGRQFEPTLPVYRALFIGFARHSQDVNEQRAVAAPNPRRSSRTVRTSAYTGSEKVGLWSYENLLPIFKSFLLLPGDICVSERTVYWILLAFDRVVGGDVERLRKVWLLLERRFGGEWGGRLEEFRSRIFDDS